MQHERDHQPLKAVLRNHVGNGFRPINSSGTHITKEKNLWGRQVIWRLIHPLDIWTDNRKRKKRKAIFFSEFTNNRDE